MLIPEVMDTYHDDDGLVNYKFRPMTDSEMEHEVSDVIERVQARIDASLASGATLVVSRQGVAHSLECPSMQGVLDIRANYSDWSTSEIAMEIHHGPGVRGPWLCTKAEAAGKFRRCTRCAPDVVPQPPKPPYEGPSTAASNLGWKHIGRMIGGQRVSSVHVYQDAVGIRYENGDTVTYGLEDRVFFDAGSMNPVEMS